MPRLAASQGRNFGIWSVAWSGDGREIIAGTNDQSVFLYDVEVGTLQGSS